jgi:hypothetical protein
MNDLTADSGGYATRRWVGLVVRTASLSDDPRTIHDCCRALGLSPSTLKSWCRVVGVTGKDSVSFARLLKVVHRHAGRPWKLQERLDIGDERTARALLKRAGCPPDLPIPPLDVFLDQQRLITSGELLTSLRTALNCPDLRLFLRPNAAS